MQEHRESLRLKLSDLASLELSKALAVHGDFNSDHEAYSVLKEEVEECEEELRIIRKQLEEIWASVKQDDSIDIWAESLGNTALRLSQEAIQVVAMCRKIKLMGGK